MPTKTPSTSNKTPSTPNKTPSTPNKTPSTPTKTPTMQSQSKEYEEKKYWFTLFCREAIFVVNLRTFLAYLLQA